MTRAPAAGVAALVLAGLAGCGGDGRPVSDTYVDLAYTHNTPLNAERWPAGQPVVFYFTAGNKGPDATSSARLAVRLRAGLQLLSFACIPDPVGRAACPTAVDTDPASASAGPTSMENGGFVTLVVSALPIGSAPLVSGATATIESESDGDTSNNAVAWSVTVE